MSQKLTPPPIRTPVVDTTGKTAYPWQAWFSDMATFVNNITGIAGAKGDKGDKGDKGEPGLSAAEGAPGATGPIGPQGEKGETGQPGPKGDPGVHGDKGGTGDVGPRGFQGIQGERGDKGDTGDVGAQGIPGEKGDTGSVGSAAVPLVLDSQNNLSIQQGNAVVDGYLSAADWTTFNAKQPAGNYLSYETDPVFAASPAAGITQQNITAWNSGGGGSSTAGQLPTYTTVQRLELTATQGAICFDSDLVQICVYTGSSWMAIPYAGMVIPCVFINNVPTNNLMPPQDITEKIPGVAVSTSVT
jgi:hypothetical protein